MDIALDANDVTRQAMPGEEFLMQMAKCSKATFYRRVKALTDARLLKVAHRAVPGQPTIYEVLPSALKAFESFEHDPRTGLANAETRSVQEFES